MNDLSLAGPWRFELDPSDKGVAEAWYKRPLEDTISLPGTTDENRKGPANQAQETLHLTRAFPCTGPAFYQRELEIPEGWQGKHLFFVMERTKHSTLWVDDRPAGTQDSLTTSHRYDLTEFLTSGEHLLTVRIDNGDIPPVGISHQTSEHTQTNWNGILGRIELQVLDELYIEDIQAFPDVSNRKLDLELQFNAACEVEVSLSAEAENTNRAHHVEQITMTVQTDHDGYVTVPMELGAHMQVWDEFTPALYRVCVAWRCSSPDRSGGGQREIVVGMRNFTTHQGQFQVNGRTTFLRGKHDACVFPLTGYAPMDAEEWERILGIARSYGINHYRFHSYCPPRAAFEAADRVGIYLQPELPLWESLDKSKIDPMGDVEIRAGDADDSIMETRIRYLVSEGLRILKEFGNHPSFCMFALGNELCGERAVMASFIERFRQKDTRHLYAQGSNNFIWGPQLAPRDDYWTTMMTGGHYRAGDFKPDCHGLEVRGSYCVHTHGHVNNRYPGTMVDYSSALQDVEVPVIGHEVGQYQVFPNFDEIDAYTGVLRARNFKVFRDRLEAAGMLDQADDFVKASGALAVLCYRKDIEAALRTPRFAGFQLLDLQDFPGQGTALVGILDAFMESKGLITAKEWRQFCSETVPLVKMETYTWTQNDTLSAELLLANYSNRNVRGALLCWRLLGVEGDVMATGELSANREITHNLTTYGSIEVGLQEVDRPRRLQLEVSLEDTDCRNSYPIWVYPAIDTALLQKEVIIARNLDADTAARLRAGKRVLLLPDHASVKQAIPGAFQSDFWCYPMFRKYNPPGTLGILCDPTHPALAEFPTDFHSNWQWWPLLRNGCAMILDDLPLEVRPIVQVIDNFERNHRLGVIFECNVGEGQLLVCSCTVLEQQHYPEAKQLLASLLQDMNSEAFRPAFPLEMADLNRLLA